MFPREKLQDLLCTNIPRTNAKVWIWGIGNTAQLYQEGLLRLDELSGCIEGYCDSNSEKIGQKFNGKTIIGPNELEKQKDIMVLICSPTPSVIREIRLCLDRMEKEYYLLDEAILKWHREDVLKAYDALEDEKSKEVYANIISARIMGSYPSERTWSDNEYFIWNTLTTRDLGGVFVDCGAYVGDTIEKFIWNREGVFDKVIAFEPDKKNCEAMQYRIRRLCNEWNFDFNVIEIIGAAVGEKTETKKFGRYEKNRGLGSMIRKDDAQDTEECQVVSLDEAVDGRYTFLKADIESYEYQMLHGAKEGIKRWKPMMAISIYHNAVDIYSIILLIKQIEAGYKLAVRHHSNTLAGTVLYAWIDE